MPTLRRTNHGSLRVDLGGLYLRDFDENGLEFISIMFEMKNEADGTRSIELGFYKKVKDKGPSGKRT